MENNKDKEYEKAYEEVSKAVAGMMFVTELAYEMAVRYTPLIKVNSAIFKQGMKYDLNRFQTSLKQYNNWMVSATRDVHRFEIIRFISDELNDYAYDAVYDLMMTIKDHFDKIDVEYSGTLSKIEVLFYLLTLANINASRHIECFAGLFPGIRNFEAMTLEPQLRILKDVRRQVIEKYVKDTVVKEDTANVIEAGLVAIMKQLTEHSTEVCQRVKVAV